MFVNHAGFSISSRKLQLVEIDFNDGRFLIENIDEEPFPFEIDAQISSSKLLTALQDAYDKIIARKNLKTDIVSFALPAFFFKSAKIPYDPNLISKDLETHLKWEFGVLFPNDNPDDFVIDKFTLGDESNELFFFAVERKILQTIHKFCFRNNLLLKYVDNSVIAGLILLPYLSEPGKKNYVSVFLNKNYFAVTFVKNHVPVFYKVFTGNEGSKEHIYNVVNELKAKHFEKTDFSDYYIFGDGLQQNIIEELNRENGVYFNTVNPFKLLKLNQRIKDNAFATQSYFNFAAPTGMAMRLI